MTRTPEQLYNERRQRIVDSVSQLMPGVSSRDIETLADSYFGTRVTWKTDCNYYLIGVTGETGVGKTTVAEIIENKFPPVMRTSFTEIARELGLAYFMLAFDAGPTNAFAMANLALGELPIPNFPGKITPRLFVEKLNWFLLRELGPEWVLKVLVDRAFRRYCVNTQTSPGTPGWVTPVIIVDDLTWGTSYFQKDLRGRLLCVEGEQRATVKPGALKPLPDTTPANPDFVIPNTGSLQDLEKEVQYHVLLPTAGK